MITTSRIMHQPTFRRNCIHFLRSFPVYDNIVCREKGKTIRALCSDFSKNGNEISGRLPKATKTLEKIKMAGIDNLVATANVLSNSSLCRKKLMDDPAKRDVSVKQQKRASKLERIVCDILEQLEVRGDESFCCEGASIEINFVETSPDLRHARLYWTLPFTLMDRTESEIQKYTSEMQRFLDARGAGYMQQRIASMTRTGYPPRIRFIASDTLLTHSEGIRRDLKRFKILEEWE